MFLFSSDGGIHLPPVLVWTGPIASLGLHMCVRSRNMGEKKQDKDHRKLTSKKSNHIGSFAMKKIVTSTASNDESEQATTTECVQQGYIVCPTENRLSFLYTFIKKNLSKKLVVFFSSCTSVKFHQEFFNYVGIQIMSIHGKQDQDCRMAVLTKFRKADSGTLLCSDKIVRGLDIPAVDWVIQFDPSNAPEEYLHRISCIAHGSSLLILRPEELEFLSDLRRADLSVNEYQFSKRKIVNIQPQLELLISKNYFLHTSAKDAFRGYVRAYTSHQLKKCFDVNTLDLGKVALSFGLKVPPNVRLNTTARQSINSRKKRKVSSKKIKTANQ